MKISITRPFPGEGISLLQKSGYEIDVNKLDRALTHSELLDFVQGADVLVCQFFDQITKEVIEAAGNQLKGICQYAVGYDNIDVEEAKKRGIKVCNTPGVLSGATADLTWALILAVTRRVIEGDRMMREGRYDGWEPYLLLGSDLQGKTLSLIGAGRIAYLVAKRSQGWDMPILYVSRSTKPDLERDFNAKRVTLEEAMQEGDIVSLHTPLNNETKHLINASNLCLMKKTAYLINTARGPVIDEKALLKALQEKSIAGAGLDVYEEEPKMEPGLEDCWNAVLLPHLGSANLETRSKMGLLVAESAIGILKEESLQYEVDQR